MPFDETEAYLRHRARVHEREKREKLKKQGKLEAYLAEIEKNKPKPEPEKVEEPKLPDFDKFMKEYYESRKFDKENFFPNKVNNSSTEKVYFHENNNNNNTEVKKKPRRRRKAKKKAENLEEEIILNEAEFKPQMAGSTGLPKFFFSNIVKQNSSALQEAQARHRMVYNKPTKKHHK